MCNITANDSRQCLQCAGLVRTVFMVKVSHCSPLNSHSASCYTVHPLFFPAVILIIPSVYSPLHPACSMTSGPSPWRTDPAFHSGSKREVMLFCCYFFFPSSNLAVHIYVLLLVGFVKWSCILRRHLWFDFLSFVAFFLSLV